MKHVNRSNPGWIAIADLGTNTFQLLIGRVENNRLETAYRYKTGVQIGKGGMAQKLILDDAVDRAVDALQHFKSILSRFEIQETDCILLGTSAFRNASNRMKVVETIHQRTGFDVRVISGELEAELIFLGVMASQVIEEGETSLIVDIGGGSVEFILCEGKKQLWRQSFEIGGLRLMDRFHLSDPIAPDMKPILFAWLDQELGALKSVINTFKPNILVGSSGSFDTLIDMYQHRKKIPPGDTESVSKYQLPISDFNYFSQKIIAANRAERLAMPGMIELRVEMIVVAVLLIQYVLDLMDNPEIRVSTFAMKEGAFFHTFSK